MDARFETTTLGLTSVSVSLFQLLHLTSDYGGTITVSESRYHNAAELGETQPT